MLYNKGGDNGISRLFGCDQGLDKSSEVFETLGALDEVNSYLGVCKTVKGTKETEFINGMLTEVQHLLFIIQADVAGAKKEFPEEKTVEAEKFLDELEKKLPKLDSFCIPGGTELSAHLDYARTLARKAERSFTWLSREREIYENVKISAYLNRLSSLLYALSRFANLKSGVGEVKPTYK